MLVISEPARGATTLLFRDEKDLEDTIAGLQRLKESKEFSKDYPASMTLYMDPESIPTNQDVRAHVKQCKRMLL